MEGTYPGEASGSVAVRVHAIVELNAEDDDVMALRGKTRMAKLLFVLRTRK